jgi:hypothetical protein
MESMAGMMRMPLVRRRVRALGALVVLALVAVGCSATPRDAAGGGNQLDVAAGSSGSELGATATSNDAGSSVVGETATGAATEAATGGATGAATGGATGGAAGAPTSGASGGAGSSRGATSGGGAIAAASSAPAGGKTGPGITATTIKVGFVYSSDLEAAAGIADRPNGEALIAGLNREGGIAGRKVEAVWHDFPLSSPQTMEQREQGMCATFTEDNKVFAVDPYWIPTENLTGCLAAKDTMMVYPGGSSSQISFDSVSFQKYPTHLWAIAAPTPDRVAKPFVAMLKEAGYFNSGAGEVGPLKIGVLVKAEAPNRRGYERAFLPALKAAGYNVADVVFATSGTSLDETAKSEQFIQSTVVRFRSEQITHVIMWDVHGWTHSDAFLRNAEQQRYRPRYGFNTTAGPQGTDATTGADNTAQVRGAVYMSWHPYRDYRLAEPSERTKTCYRWLKEGGRPVLQAPALGNALGNCQTLMFLKDGLERASELTAVGVRAAIEQLGAMPGVVTPQLGFGPGRHDGAAVYQRLEYDFDCAAKAPADDKNVCWRPKSPFTPF